MQQSKLIQKCTNNGVIKFTKLLKFTFYSCKSKTKQITIANNVIKIFANVE